MSKSTIKDGTVGEIRDGLHPADDAGRVVPERDPRPISGAGEVESLARRADGFDFVALYFAFATLFR